jgi:ACR3 family arsenite efflux pump ArsB
MPPPSLPMREEAQSRAMTTWTAKRVAWAIGGFSLVLMIATLVLMFVDRGADLPENVGS